MNALIATIQSKIQLDKDTQEVVMAAFTERVAKKGDFLIKEAQYAQHIYFIESGTVRTFFYHDGKEITSWIYPENLFCTTWYSFLSQQPSFEYVEVMGPSVLYEISFSDLNTLYQNYPALSEFGRKMVEEQLSFIDYFSKGYTFLSAAERYELLLSFFPDVEQRVNLGHVASLLGISQETLSRIRSKK
ncbi:MAG: Crp/Fnr family transcriptional regulator [Bacteroidota bacterium]